MSESVHPRVALYEPDETPASTLPVCDHYSGVEARMRKSLELQAELGPVFDVTLDGEDGAPVGGEHEHALLMSELVNSAANRFGRVGIRVPPVEHPAFEDMVSTVVGQAGARVAYLMIPKPRGLAEIVTATRANGLRGMVEQVAPCSVNIGTRVYHDTFGIIHTLIT